jgi:hypothetical protein
VSQDEASRAAERIMLEVDESVRLARGEAAGVAVHVGPGEVKLVPWGAPDSYEELAEHMRQAHVPFGWLVIRRASQPAPEPYQIGVAPLARGPKGEWVEPRLEEVRQRWKDRLQQVTPEQLPEWWKYI